MGRGSRWRTLVDTGPVRYAFGQAASFNGASSYAVIPDAPSLSPSNKWTFATWLYWDSKVGDKTIAAKWNYTGTTGGTFFLGSAAEANQPIGLFVVASNNDQGSNSAKFPGTAVSAGVWTHLALVYDGALSGNANRVKGFINGVQQTMAFSGTIPANMMDTAHELVLGAWNVLGNKTRFWNGDLDEVLFYKEALSAEQIAQIYDRFPVGTPSAWWRCNGSIDDASGNLNNANVVANVTYVSHA